MENIRFINNIKFNNSLNRSQHSMDRREKGHELAYIGINATEVSAMIFNKLLKRTIETIQINKVDARKFLYSTQKICYFFFKILQIKKLSHEEISDKQDLGELLVSQEPVNLIKDFMLYRFKL